MRCPSPLLVVLALTLTGVNVAAQSSAPPKLTKPQHDALRALVAATDAAMTTPDTAQDAWQTHVLRTSDGAHYVAFRVAPSNTAAAIATSTVYVRLATRAEASAMVERSAVAEWLKGMRSDPLVARKQRGVVFGEMPVMGAGAAAARGASSQATDLALLSFEQERQKQQKDAADKQRRAALEGSAAARSRDAVYPFEDFSVDASPSPTAVVERAVIAGPGDYDLYVAWSDAPAQGRAPAIHVARHHLQLPAASPAEFAISTVILADSVTTRATPYPPDQQTAHPYAIGPMEIVPAADDTLTNDERLTAVFQLFNPRPGETGKPDVGVAFQLLRLTPGGEQSVAALNPLTYNSATLPPDFDLTKGQPLFAAMAAPLRTLPRGEYRLKITAVDRIGARNAFAETTFRVVATPAALLASAPTAVPLNREYLLDRGTLAAVATTLRVQPVSAAVSAAIDAISEARFIDALRDEQVPAADQAVRATVRGIALFALGDPRVAATMLRQAVEAGPNAAAQLYFGATRALDGNARDALAAWQRAIDIGLPAAVVAPLSAPIVAAQQITEGREADAIALLAPVLAEHPDHVDAQYEMLHALFAGFVRNSGRGASAEGKEEFRTRADRYIVAKGRYAALVAEWGGFVK